MATVPKEIVRFSETEKEAIRRQAERLLSSRYFSGSKRYPAFLRYVIEQTLEGNQEVLKERTLGIEVFERSPHFDTSGDSIVRVTAAEVRKRIALYYQDPSHDAELRISLPPGSYVPRFRGTDPVADSQSRPQLAIPAHQDVTAATAAKPRKLPRFFLPIAVVVVIGLVVALGFWAHWNSPRTLLESFWGSRFPVMICMGSPNLAVNQPGADDPAVVAALGPPTTNNTLVPLSDAVTLGRLQALLDAHRQDYRIILARHASLDDLRSGPSILIGALDNPWTLRITSKLRYQFRGNEATMGQIVDTKSGKDTRWAVNFQIPYSDRTQDYAIVALDYDDTVGQPVLVVAGAGPNGTRAAGEFLTSQADLASIRKMAPPGWRGRNLEIVLATQVIQGYSSPPRVLAAEFW